MVPWRRDGALREGRRKNVDERRIGQRGIHGIAFATLSLCIGALYSRALKQADALGLDRDERAMTAGEVATWWLAVAVAALSALSAALLPDNPPYWLAGAPGLVYFLMNLSWWVARRARDRSLARSA